MNLYGFVANNPVNLIDMLGLYSFLDGVIDSAANYAAGFGDYVSGGVTRMVREAYSVEGVNYDSGAYAAGTYTGIAHDVAMAVAMGKPTGLKDLHRAAGRTAKGIFSKKGAAVAGGIFLADRAARGLIDKYADACNRDTYKTLLTGGERAAGYAAAVYFGGKGGGGGKPKTTQYKTKTVNGKTYELRPSKGGAGPNRWHRQGGAPKPQGSSNSNHGNTRTPDTEASIYGKYDKDGNFQKWGKSQDPQTRYSRKKLDGGFVDEYQRGKGPTDQILNRERRLIERYPGPQNKEPWAGKRNPNHPNYDPNYKGKQ